VAEPDPIEPQSGELPTPAKSEERADWLCGPEEGIQAELGRNEREAGTPVAAPKLTRPDSGEIPEPGLRFEHRAESGSMPAPKLVRPVPSPEDQRRMAPPPSAPPSAKEETAVEPGMSWGPGANSIPVLRRETPPPHLALVPPLRAAAPSSPMDFPMDDAEERTQVAAAAAAAGVAASERASRPHLVVAPDAFDIANAPAPWWMQLPVLLREDRRVQLLAGLGVVLLLTIALWPKPEKTLSLSAIRHDPSHFDGQSVKVSGRVGEVFEMGGGYAFYLHQGRDTLVVFTRSRTPRRGDNVTVGGSMSTGYLNGQAGTALFESVAAK